MARSRQSFPPLPPFCRRQEPPPQKSQEEKTDDLIDGRACSLEPRDRTKDSREPFFYRPGSYSYPPSNERSHPERGLQCADVSNVNSVKNPPTLDAECMSSKSLEMSRRTVAAFAARRRRRRRPGSPSRPRCFRSFSALDAEESIKRTLVLNTPHAFVRMPTHGGRISRNTRDEVLTRTQDHIPRASLRLRGPWRHARQF